jgi:tRNA pseudouridine38-40 synthase
VLVERVELVEEGALILIRLAASHFLWKMVRRVVGALVKVGAGELSAQELDAMLRGTGARRSTAAEWTAPPSGLFLERVMYAGDPSLAPLRAIVPIPAETA